MARATWAPLPTSFWIRTKASNMGSPPGWHDLAWRHDGPRAAPAQATGEGVDPIVTRPRGTNRRIRCRGSPERTRSILERAASPGHNQSPSRPEEGSPAPRPPPPALRPAWVLLAVAASGTAGAGVTPTAVLAASPSTITAGDTVKLSGSVAAEQSCLGPRPVVLEWHAAGSAAWGTVASSTTGADRTFSVSRDPQT